MNSPSQSGPIFNNQPLPAGTRLDARYEVVDLLGAGGFALVYRARQLPINRLVALKVLTPPLDPTMRATYHTRFLREAQAAAQIQHPCSVAVHDYGIHQGSPYIAMELLEGHDLKVELERHGPMEPRRAVSLFCGCLEALGEGHKLKIVHKDLKPSNLFLRHPETRRESLCILDFGVAHLGGSEDGRATMSGAVLGTPKYYAPEYAREQRISPALDVYQMGLILVEMLTSQPVVSLSDPYACLLRHCSGALELPLPLLEGPLGPILAKALALLPENRYEDAHAFRDALEKIDASQIPRLPAAPITRSLHDYSGNAKGLVSVAMSGMPLALAPLDVEEAPQPAPQAGRASLVRVEVVPARPTEQDDAPIDLGPYRKAEPTAPQARAEGGGLASMLAAPKEAPQEAPQEAQLPDLEAAPLDLSLERPVTRGGGREAGAEGWRRGLSVGALVLVLGMCALFLLLKAKQLWLDDAPTPAPTGSAP